MRFVFEGDNGDSGVAISVMVQLVLGMLERVDLRAKPVNIAKPLTH